jgi:hypothetical protein
MITERHIFPKELPPGYEYLESEPQFVPEEDLALRTPEDTVTLAELGYSERFRQNYGSPLAATAPFPFLSEGGVAKLRTVVDRLRGHIRYNPDTKRVPAVMRGTAFRSRFVRDLSLAEPVVDFFSEIAGLQLVPTAFSHQLGHMNFPPQDLSQSIAGWHCDENAFVVVFMVHDPAELEGGEFQYFGGTRYEGEQLLAERGDIPEERLVAPKFPGAGSAVLMQGSAILHRAAPQLGGAERISVVTCYDTADTALPDPNRFYFVTGGFGDVNPDARLERFCRYTEYARHKAWRSRARLHDVIENMPFTLDRERVISMLEDGIADVVEAIEVLKRGDVTRDEAKRLRRAEDERWPR